LKQLLIRLALVDAGLQLEAPTAGMKWTMMRHGNKVKHLGRPADQRKALIRSLVTEVLRHGAITTTKVSCGSFRGVTQPAALYQYQCSMRRLVNYTLFSQ
jgi:hypothetical protein